MHFGHIERLESRTLLSVVRPVVDGASTLALAPRVQTRASIAADTGLTVTNALLDNSTTIDKLVFSFSADVSTGLSTASLVLTNLTTGSIVPTASTSLAYDSSTQTATFTFPGLSNQRLPDGRYTATLVASLVTDSMGHHLAADYTFNFNILAGDTNGDGTVDFQDLVTLARNYGKPGGVAQGDCDRDGGVDFKDLVILARNYGKKLPPGMAPFVLGQPVNGTLAVAGGHVVYTFVGSVGQRLYFDGITGANGLSATITDPDGGIVASSAIASDTGPFSLAKSGTYQLTVNGTSGATGSYSFNLLDVASQPQATLGTPYSGTLDPGTSAAIYRLAVSAGQHLFFTNTSPVDATDFTSAWRLYGPDNGYQGGAYLRYPSSRNFELTLNTAGSYTLVLAGGNPSKAVNYAVRVVSADANAQALTLGTPVSGTVAQAGDVNEYTFTATAGQKVFYNGRGGDANINARLVGPNGTVFEVAAGQDQGPLTLTQGGAYQLLVYGVSAATGSYSFNLLDVAAQPQATLGTPYSGTLDPGTSVAIYRLTVSAGQHLFFTDTSPADATDFTSAWRLYGPDNGYQGGAYLRYPSSRNFELTPNTAGSYTLVLAGGNPSKAVNYAVRVVSADANAQALTLGTPVSGTVAQAGDVNEYTFTATAGQKVFYNGRSGDANINARLVGPNGTVFEVAAGQDQGPLTLTQGGAYQLLVYGVSAATGSYSFNLLDVAAQPQATLGTTYSGTLNPGTSVAIYRLTVSAGQHLFFTDTSPVDATDFTSAWRLYGPDNGYQGGAYLSYPSSRNFELTPNTAGSYTLVLAGGNPSKAVDYAFEVTSQ